jgi:hypothetical protein
MFILNCKIEYINPLIHGRAPVLHDVNIVK